MRGQATGSADQKDRGECEEREEEDEPDQTLGRLAVTERIGDLLPEALVHGDGVIEREEREQPGEHEERSVDAVLHQGEQESSECSGERRGRADPGGKPELVVGVQVQVAIVEDLDADDVRDRLRGYGDRSDGETDPQESGRTLVAQRLDRHEPIFAMHASSSVTTGARASDRVLALGRAFALLGGAALLLGHVVNHLALDDRIGELQASAEHNVWSWAATMATLAAGLAALLHSRSSSAPRESAALGVLLVFFSLDDFLEIHENAGLDVSESLGLPDYVGPRLWVVLYLPLAAAGLLLLWRVAAELGGRPRSSILLGVALFGSGYLLEAAGIVTKRIEEGGFELPHLIRAGLEESVELAGWILVAAGLAAGMLAAASDS